MSSPANLDNYRCQKGRTFPKMFCLRFREKGFQQKIHCGYVSKQKCNKVVSYSTHVPAWFNRLATIICALNPCYSDPADHRLATKNNNCLFVKETRQPQETNQQTV
jgi:hypothetical protein